MPDQNRNRRLFFSKTVPGITPTYIEATGGTITEIGDYRLHSFYTDADFKVDALGNQGGFAEEILIVAGGGGGSAGAGGGGGVIQLFHFALSLGAYNIVVGVGGNGSLDLTLSPGSNGGNSSIDPEHIAIGGGGGGGYEGVGGASGVDGGSGGGGGIMDLSTQFSIGGGGNPPQGYKGGRGYQQSVAYQGGSGGGAQTPASDVDPFSKPGIAGDGKYSDITGVGAYYGGGGGGNGDSDLGIDVGEGGLGGGGRGGDNRIDTPPGTDGENGTGGGGGAGTFNTDVSPSGGSGVVMIKYKFK